LTSLVLAEPIAWERHAVQMNGTTAGVAPAGEEITAGEGGPHEEGTITDGTTTAKIEAATDAIATEADREIEDMATEIDTEIKVG